MGSWSVIGPCAWRYEVPVPGTHAFRLCKSSASHRPSLGHGSHIDPSLCCLAWPQPCGSVDRHHLPKSPVNNVSCVFSLLLIRIPRVNSSLNTSVKRTKHNANKKHWSS